MNHAANLQGAIYNDDTAEALAAIEAGADLSDGKHLSLALGISHYNVAAALVEAGADPNMPRGSMDNPVWWDIFPRFDWDEFEVQQLERLLDLGARIDATNSHGHNPLLWFCLRHLPPEPNDLEDQLSLQVIDTLTARGVDVNDADQRGQTALHTVCLDRHRIHEGLRLAVAAKLLDLGASIDARSRWPQQTGWTALMIAASVGRLELVRLLADRGADVGAATDEKDPDTALSLALSRRHDEVIALLQERGASEPPERERRERFFGHAAAGKWEETLRIADQVLADFPDGARVYQCAAWANNRAGDFEQAERLARTALKR